MARELEPQVASFPFLGGQDQGFGAGEFRWDVPLLQAKFGIPDGYHLVVDAVQGWLLTGAASTLCVLAFDKEEDWDADLKGTGGTALSHLIGHVDRVFKVPLIALVPFYAPLGVHVRRQIDIDITASVNGYMNFNYHFEEGGMDWSRVNAEPLPMTVLQVQRSAGEPHFRAGSPSDQR